MEENKIVISKNEYAALVVAKTQLQTIERMLAKSKYISEEIMKIILNIEGEETK